MAKKLQPTQLVVNQIVVRPPQRQLLDVAKWTAALRAADMGKYNLLLDLYDNVLLDGVLADAVDKRIRAVTGSDLTFQYKDGTESTEMIALIDTVEFELLLSEIMQAIFQHISVIEFTFDDKGMHLYSIPRKNIRVDKQTIAENESDPEGFMSYAEAPNMIEVRNRKDKYGILLRACPYAIFKRGGIGDWAQMVEIFGMPKRIGKYNMHDVESRKMLQEAFDTQGAGASMVVPKETEIETDNSSSSVNGSLYKDFIDTMDEQLLITILSQTMTTKDGSSHSQSETHKSVEEMVNKHDMRFVQRVLNQSVLPILEARGYPVKDGTFVFPKATEQATVAELAQMAELIDIPAYYFQERYGIPQAAEGDVIAKKKQASAEPEPQEPEPPKGKSKLNNADDEAGFFMRLKDFFSDAPTTQIGASDKKSWTSYISNSVLNLSDQINYGININKLFEQAIKEVYDNAGKDVVNPTLYELCNQPLQKAVAKGFTTSFGKKNKAFVSEFRQNTAVFAAFKAHAQGNDIAAQLLNENGDLRSFHEFKKAVLGTSISADYNKNWLKTEYNQAVRSARTAEKFKKYEATKHLYPNLEYLPSTAATPREEHKKYYGTILPIDDPWWDTHTPPLAWGCECGIRNTDKAATTIPDDVGDVNPVLANNPAKTAEFLNTAKHPYVKGVCKEFATCQYRIGSLMQLADKPNKPACGICAFPSKEAQEAVLKRRYDKQWRVEHVKENNGGYIVEQQGHGKEESPQNIKSATPLANNGAQVELIKQETIRVEGSKKKITTRDANVYGIPNIESTKWEFKYTKDYKKLSKSIGTKAHQSVDQGAEVCLVDIVRTDKYSISEVIEGVYNSFHYNERLKGMCIMIESDKYFVISREYYLGGQYKTEMKKWLNSIN